MSAGFPILGSRVAVASMALTAVIAVASAGYVGIPGAVGDAVANSDSMADKRLGD